MRNDSRPNPIVVVVEISPKLIQVIEPRDASEIDDWKSPRTNGLSNLTARRPTASNVSFVEAGAVIPPLVMFYSFP